MAFGSYDQQDETVREKNTIIEVKKARRRMRSSHVGLEEEVEEEPPKKRRRSKSKAASPATAAAKKEGGAGAGAAAGSGFAAATGTGTQQAAKTGGRCIDRQCPNASAQLLRRLPRTADLCCHQDGPAGIGAASHSR